MKNYQQCIGGALSTGSGKTFTVINPANEEIITSLNESSIEQVDAAVADALDAFHQWKTTSNDERNKSLLDVAAIVEDNKNELASLITKEQGKPLFLAMIEVDAAIGWINYTTTLELNSEVIEDSDQRIIEKHYRPLGVVASITPWNWPLMIAIWHIIPAIKSGNTVVIKPSNLTPLSTLLLIELMNKVLPRGVINSVIGDTDVGQALTAHKDVSKVVFTGSTPTGQNVLKNAVGSLKKVTLELGGNDPAFVLGDVDVDAIAPAIFQTAFLNMGQTCAAIKRLYVHESVYDALCAQLKAIAESVVVGDGFNTDTTFGPIQNAKQLMIVKELIDDAIANGANILTGGDRLDQPGYFYPPTLITNVQDGIAIVDEEQFGPVLPIIKFSDIDTVIDKANENPNGLGSSIWTSNIEVANKLAARIEAGTTWINNHAEVLPHCPFGGCKMSGLGVEFGEEGFKEYTQIHITNRTK